MTSELPIRPVSLEEYASFAHVIEHGFGGEPDAEELHEQERELLEFDRTLAVIDDDRPVASAAAYSFQMSVPGGQPVPTAGVTWVAVMPTHRRRGILTRLMRRQLDDIHAAGREPIAALWASESSIYGRFGYGRATSTLSFVVPRAYNQLRPVPGTADLRVRLVEPSDSLAGAHAIYEHERSRRPGVPDLPNEKWVQARVLFPESRREGGSPLRTLLVEDASGALRGYARYSTKSTWERTGAAGTATVRELHAVDAAATAKAWEYLLNLDLTTTTRTYNRASDDPLLDLLVDPRRAAPEWGDGLYVRIVDVGAALSARRYATPVDVVIDVRDPFCDWNSGSWRLKADPAGAHCERSDPTADLSLDVRELGAVYLGGTSLVALAGAGLVTEHRAGAVTALSTACRHEPAPWTPFVF
ncbi:MAG: GNAT family N-acetyltransferase [Propionibacteriales bacterium]|nr:GNAT family N-acetyltransferase [Propionibacteriales bacterium]